MAGTSLLVLLDDITTILDDVALMTRVSAEKTAGVLGDDLALNAEQVSGVRAERELPVVFAVAKGSAVNKLILVPAALLLSALWPAAVQPLLMLGGLYLCFEGAEKVLHKLADTWAASRAAPTTATGAADAAATATTPTTATAVVDEATKIRGAIRTDFVLSAEIVVISLGVVADAPLATRIAVLAGIAVLMTVGVYGLVAGIVKLDDLGLHLLRRGGAAAASGRLILRLAPWLMRGLSVVGTAAMFLVGGGILVHGTPALHHAIEALVPAAGGVGAAVARALLPLTTNLLVGFAAGCAVVAGTLLGKKLLAPWRRR
jgi:predicted DNA repair protein MutK